MQRRLFGTVFTASASLLRGSVTEPARNKAAPEPSTTTTTPTGGQSECKPKQDPHGVWNGSLAPGGVYMLTCLNGYSVEGNSSLNLSCTHDLQWPADPWCENTDYFLGRRTSPRPELSETARAAPPGYAGHRPTNLKDKSSPPPSVCSETRSEASTITGGRAPVSTRAARAMPGYGGHIPGKHADGVCGRTFRAANKEAVSQFRAPVPEEISVPHDQLHSRVLVPGYSGHIPGKVSDNLYGTSHVRAARTGWLVEQRRRELGGGLVMTD